MNWMVCVIIDMQFQVIVNCMGDLATREMIIEYNISIRSIWILLEEQKTQYISMA